MFWLVLLTILFTLVSAFIGAIGLMSREPVFGLIGIGGVLLGIYLVHQTGIAYNRTRNRD